MSESLAQMAVTPSGTVERVALSRNFAWTLAGNVVYAACQWGILIAIAKLGTPAMVGQFALGLAVSAPVFMFTGLQLRTVLATDAGDEYRLGNYLALRILGTGIGLALILGFVLLSRFGRDTAIVVLLVSLAKAAETFSDVFYGFWQKHEHFAKIARALGGRGVGSLVAMSAVLHFTHKIAAGTGAMALFWTVWLLTYERNAATLTASASREHLSPQWDKEKMRQLLMLVSPLGLVAVLASLNANIPRYFIEHDWGDRSLGYFASAAYLPVAGNTLIIALCQAAAPHLAQHYRASRRAFLQLTRRMVLMAGSFGVVGFLVALLFGKRLLTLFYRPDYAQYHLLFVWLMVVAVLNYIVTVLCQAMTASRMIRPQLGLFLLTTLSITICGRFFVPRFGLEGAAYALLAGAVISCVGAVCLSGVAVRGSKMLNVRMCDIER